MNKNLLWAFLSAVILVFGLVRGEIHTGKGGLHRLSYDESPEVFVLYIAVFAGLVLLFLYRAFTRSDR